MTEFTEKYKDNKWVALTYINRPLGTHKNLNGIARNIPILKEFLQNLQKSGVLDNTVVLIGGDHGNGFIEDYFKTQIGSYEARLPLAYAIFPKWFQTKYKKAYDNVKFNGKNRLTSHYDTYKTFKAIISQEYKNPPDVAQVDEEHPGVSLFQPLPEWRGCKEAGVPAHYCLCESFTPLPHDDPRVIKACRTIVDTLNQKLQSTGDLCVKYENFHVNISKITETGDGFSIILKMIPYPGNFRVYVRKEGDTYTAHDVERLDNYRDLASCLDKLGEMDTFKQDSHLASYCVCSDLKLNYRKRLDE